jgi:TRAP-type transport system small permease protein
VNDDQSSGAPLLRTAVRLITAVEVGVAGLATAAIFALVLLQSAQRYLPMDGYTWTGELARFCLVWLTFAAIGVLVTRDGHLALQMVDTLPNPMVVRIVHVLALALVAAISAAFAWACWDLVTESRNLTSPSLGLPMAYVYVVPALGFLSAAIRASVAAVLVAVRGVAEASHADELAIQVNPPVSTEGGDR